MAASSSAPPLLVTKLAYGLFKAECQAYVKKVQEEGKLHEGQLRLLKNVLNDFTQSIFLQARAHLLIKGNPEPDDDSLPPLISKAQEEFKAARIQLNSLHNEATKLIEAVVRAPLAHLDDQGRERDEKPIERASIVAPDPDAIARVQERSTALASAVSDLSAIVPPVVAATADLSKFLSERGAKPASAEVRAMIERVSKEAAAATRRAGRRSGRNAAAASSQPASATPGKGGKIAKSPSTRKAREATKPY